MNTRRDLLCAAVVGGAVSPVVTGVDVGVESRSVERGTADTCRDSSAARTITIDGGGDDIWNTADQFHFYYESLEGDFDVTVHVGELEASHEWAKAGIMVRQRLAPNAENAMLRLRPNGEASVQWRSDDGDETDSTTSDDVGIGAIDASWLRLVREGDTITGYGSADGSDWIRIARLTTAHLDMSEQTYVGLAVTSHDRGTLATATFDDLTGLSPTDNGDIGDVAVSGDVSTTDCEDGDSGDGDDGGGVTVGPGTYRLVNVDSGQYLAVEGGSEEKGAPLRQSPDGGDPGQHWNVERLEDGEYRLTATHSGHVADVRGESTESGTDVIQWPWHGGDNQRWSIDALGADEYRIEAVHSGQVMGVAGSSTDDDAHVRQQEWDGRDGRAGQKWRFEAIDREEGEDEGGETGVSQFALGDGFATPAPWLDDDTQVITVREPTRSAVEAAFRKSGPRVVVFETSGTIDLGGDRLRITEDKCWVAGQTAPSPGITFVNGMLQIAADDCIVQHVRSRIGPGTDGNIQGNDSLNTADGTSNNVVDHVSASWGTDECMSVGYDTDGTTYTNNLIYEGLYDPYGDKADHNYGTLVGDGADRVALLGNVWAKTRSRIPRLKGDTRSVVANNLCYFFDEATAIDGSAETSFVANTYAGNTATGDQVIEGDGTVYALDNAVVDPPLDSGTSLVEPETVNAPPLWPDGLEPIPSADIEDHNLANAGARPADRTANDRRIVREIRTRAGNDRLDSEYDYWIPHPDAVGGYPDLPEHTRSLSVPESGLRDWLHQWARAVETPDASPP